MCWNLTKRALTYSCRVLFSMQQAFLVKVGFRYPLPKVLDLVSLSGLAAGGGTLVLGGNCRCTVAWCPTGSAEPLEIRNIQPDQSRLHKSPSARGT